MCGVIYRARSKRIFVQKSNFAQNRVFALADAHIVVPLKCFPDPDSGKMIGYIEAKMN
jgi:hypothetical protein